MWSPRAQSDRLQFGIKWREILEKTKNVDFWQDMVTGLVLSGKRVTGVKTKLGIVFNARCIILTNGTFINGLMHVGKKQANGRSGRRATFFWFE
ncbi:tRNA uridine 5-carboxymethylaminomethyl modification enzyme MnmG [subsurface metagenome]